MAKRKIELFVDIHSEKDFEHALKNHADQLICAEIYCEFAGACTALDNLFNTMKLDWSNGTMVLLKVPADEIEALARFRGHSEPVFMFILGHHTHSLLGHGPNAFCIDQDRKSVITSKQALGHRTTKVFRGVDSLKFAEVAKRELNYYNEKCKGVIIDRPSYEINEATPDEMEWIRKESIDKQLETLAMSAKREARQAERKRHRAEQMVPFLQNYNFVLFWPHCFYAHPELYEKWDMNNIIMVGREEVELTEETARDVLYAGDAPLNEASLLKLVSGPSLAICFRLLDTDKHFVSLVRTILYEELPVYDETKPANDQPPRVTAYDRYKTFSPTRDEVMEERRKERIRRREEAIESRARRLSEMQRMARQAIADTLEAQRIKRERRRLELLKTGNLQALGEFDKEPDEEIDIEIPEELPDEYVEEESDEDPDEYLPPPGLQIPGFYSPPSDIGKVNGLAILFPKLIADFVTPEPEFLPPHILVMLEIPKRYKAIEAISRYKNAIIHMGIFEATSPQKNRHLAYSVKQYDTLDMNSLKQEEISLVFMLSVEKDLPVLQLMDLCPMHVSRDTTNGADECAAMFDINYGDEYPEFEDFDTENK